MIMTIGAGYSRIPHSLPHGQIRPRGKKKREKQKGGKKQWDCDKVPYIQSGRTVRHLFAQEELAELGRRGASCTANTTTITGRYIR